MPHSGLKPKNENHPYEEDDLWLKTVLDGGLPSMEDDLRWKTTFDRRQPLTEDDFWRKTPFDGRRPLTEDDLHIVGRHTALDNNENNPKEDDNLRWKTTFDRVYSILPGKKRLWLLTLTATAQLTLNRKSYQLSKPEIEFHVMEEMFAAFTHVQKRRHLLAKTTKP